MSPKTFLFILLLIIAAATGGYYYGFSKSTQAQKEIAALKQELDRAQFKLKILVDIRQKLNTAQVEIARKNFGLAQKEVETAQNILKELQKKAEPALKKKLEELTPVMQEIVKGLAAMDFATVGKIEELKATLEKLALA